MHARHTQAPAGFRAASSKTLVNRARMKVVNIALTKKLSSFRDAPLGAGPESILPMVVMDSGLVLTRAPE